MSDGISEWRDYERRLEHKALAEAHDAKVKLETAEAPGADLLPDIETDISSPVELPIITATVPTARIHSPLKVSGHKIIREEDEIIYGGRPFWMWVRDGLLEMIHARGRKMLYVASCCTAFFALGYMVGSQ